MIKKILSIFFCIIWMGIIFYNSSNSGYISNKRSYTLLNKLRSEYRQLKGDKDIGTQNVKTNVKNVSSNNNKKNTIDVPNTTKEEKLNIFVRKNAHAFEYLILALLVSSALFSFNLKGKSMLIYIMFICLFYAVTDEFHQMYVPGRTSLVSDVLIDFAGSLIGMGIFYLFYYKILKRENF